ncbi:hypothetical protein FRC07_008881 [Ceratobasidium sp. 392]|nr:hypothetical protein FRC07_008881 [Ceratobasidium sp. 392]
MDNAPPWSNNQPPPRSTARPPPCPRPASMSALPCLAVHKTQWARKHTTIFEPIQPLMQYKLDLRKHVTSDEDVNHNLEVFNAVHPNTFHCLQYNPPYRHYESDLLTHAIAALMFGHPNAVGVVYRDYFNPMPLTTVVFVLSIMQFCLEERETGQFRARDLSMTDMLNKYVAHLKGLKEARAGAKNRMERLQQLWFDFGYEYSGSVRSEETYYQPITLWRDIRPDTPKLEAETPSTSEPEDLETNEEGRYTAQAKGKGRAGN